MNGLLWGAAATGVAVVAAPAVLGLIGFGSAGIISGSLAAWLQGAAITAGGPFATLQSFAAVGGFTLAGGATTVAAGGGLGAAVGAAADARGGGATAAPKNAAICPSCGQPNLPAA